MWFCVTHTQRGGAALLRRCRKEADHGKQFQTSLTVQAANMWCAPRAAVILAVLCACAQGRPACNDTMPMTSALNYTSNFTDVVGNATYCNSVPLTASEYIFVFLGLLAYICIACCGMLVGEGVQLDRAGEAENARQTQSEPLGLGYY